MPVRVHATARSGGPESSASITFEPQATRLRKFRGAGNGASRPTGRTFNGRDSGVDPPDHFRRRADAECCACARPHANRCAASRPRFNRSLRTPDDDIVFEAVDEAVAQEEAYVPEVATAPQPRPIAAEPASRHHPLKADHDCRRGLAGAPRRFAAHRRHGRPNGRGRRPRIAEADAEGMAGPELGRHRRGSRRSGTRAHRPHVALDTGIPQ